MTSSRIRIINAAEPRPGGAYVLYWMQQSQRARFNPALEVAIEEANARSLPVLVCFGLTDGATGYPEANARHYAFMLEGSAEVERSLRERGIGFVIRRDAPDRVALRLGEEAALVVCDRGYLKPQKAWRASVARSATCRVVEVEGDVVVPVEMASPKHEVAARTLRPKLYRVWENLIAPLEARPVVRRADDLRVKSDFDLSDVPGAGLRDHLAHQQQVLSRRARRQLVHQRPLGLRPSRPPLGAPQRVRDRTVHGSGDAEEIRRRRLRADRRPPRGGRGNLRRGWAPAPEGLNRLRPSGSRLSPQSQNRLASEKAP